MQVHHTAPWLAPCFGQRPTLEDLDSTREGREKSQQIKQLNNTIRNELLSGATVLCAFHKLQTWVLQQAEFEVVSDHTV